jgi:hypothetical protein
VVLAFYWKQLEHGATLMAMEVHPLTLRDMHVKWLRQAEHPPVRREHQLLDSGLIQP